MNKMIALCLAVFGMASSTFADVGTSTGAIGDSLPGTAPLTNRFAVELVGSMNGSFGANTYTTNKPDTAQSTTYISDTSAAIGVRRYFSETFSIGFSVDFGAWMADGGRQISETIYQFDSNASQTFLHPALLGFRYQLTSLGGSDLLHPYAEFAFGPTFVNRTGETGDYTSNRTAYISVRPTLGLDAFLTRATHAYIGARAAYLAVNKEGLSNLQTSVVLGYLF